MPRTGIKAGPFSGSKRAARRAAYDLRRSDRLKDQLTRVQMLASQVRGPEHLREILSGDDTLTPEMRDSIYKLVFPLLPEPDEAPTTIVLTDGVRH